MTITKKDTIVLAVLFNIVVLACVVATAHQVSSKTDAPVRENGPSMLLRAVDDKEIADKYGTQEDGGQSFDEIDQLLEEYISEEAPDAPPQAVQTKETKAPSQSSKSKETIPSDEYYIVKAGDNPWKIAKRFHLSFEKLLLLNGLDEAKARNLKIGQKLRIREKR